jgi:DNA-directed RNA polymerase specialized sigma24 family protein
VKFEELITVISNNNKFVNICKKLTKGEDYQDLWHDVIIKLIEKKHAFEKSENHEQYVVACIYSTFLDGLRKSKSRTTIRLVGNEYLVQDYDLDHEQGAEYKFFEATQAEVTARYRGRRAVSELHKKMSESDEGANLLWRVIHTNIHTVSKEESTSFYQIKKKIEPIKKQIKRKLDE